MKILFLTLYPFTGNNSGMMRNRALITGLKELGHIVDVLTIKENKYQKTTDIGDLKNLSVYYAKPNIVYDFITDQKSKSSKFKEIAARFVRVIAHKVYPYDYTMKIAKKINLSVLNTRKYDLLISSSNPISSHIAAKKLIDQGLEIKKWVQYWGDPLSNNISNTVIIPNIILRILENKILRGADKIVYVSPLTLEYERKVHNNMKFKMEWIPIAYEKELCVNKEKQHFISYFGDYVSKTRNIIPFYEAMKELGADCIIAGNGDANITSTDNIIVLNRCDISQFMQETKILIVILNKKGIQIPGKIYHSAGTNIQILIIMDGDAGTNMNKYFEKYGRFEFCANKKEEIIEKVKCMLRDDSTIQPEKMFCQINIAKRFLKLIY